MDHQEEQAPIIFSDKAAWMGFAAYVIFFMMIVAVFLWG
jgi:hypothetical protein